MTIALFPLWFKPLKSQAAAGSWNEFTSLHFTPCKIVGVHSHFIFGKINLPVWRNYRDVFLFFIFFSLKNGFHECSFSSVNPWIQRFAAKGNSKMKKIKIEKKKKKTFDCPIGSLAAAVVSNYRILLFSNHITFIWETVACSLQPKAGRIWYCWLCQSNSHIFFYVLVYSSIITLRSNKNRSIRTVIDSIKIAMKAAGTRTYWTVK